MSSRKPIPSAGTPDDDSKPSFSKFVYDVIKQAEAGYSQQANSDNEDHSDREIRRISPSSSSSKRSVHMNRDDSHPESPTNPNSPSSEARSSLGYSSYMAGNNQQVHEPQMADLADFIEKKFEAERGFLLNGLVDQLLPRVDIIATEAAGREIDKFVAGMGRETTEEKMRAIQDRMQDLPSRELERLFVKRTMVTTLQRLQERLELEAACDEWEDLGPGRTQ